MRRFATACTPGPCLLERIRRARSKGREGAFYGVGTPVHQSLRGASGALGASATGGLSQGTTRGRKTEMDERGPSRQRPPESRRQEPRMSPPTPSSANAVVSTSVGLLTPSTSRTSTSRMVTWLPRRSLHTQIPGVDVPGLSPPFLKAITLAPQEFAHKCSWKLQPTSAATD